MATSRKQLLADVVRVHKNATRKVSRLNNKGVKVGGTRNDPRENLKDVRNMSTRELREYRQRLGVFNSRDTAFAPGVKGKALDASKFREYKRLEALYNKNLKSRIEQFGDVKIPGNDLTVSERYQRMIPKGRSIGGGTSRFHPYDRSSKGFPNDKAIDKAIEDMEKRMVPGFIAQQDQKIRENFMKLMEYSDRPDVLEAAAALTPEQFEVLWNFDNLVSNAAENYQIMLDLLSAKADATDREAANDIYDQMMEKFKAVTRRKLFT